MTDKVKKLALLNLPYLIFVYLFDKLCQGVRLSPGADASEKLLHIGQGFSAAFASLAPSFHLLDLCVGAAGAVLIRLAVYSKGKNAKKYRRGIEYGSARWGTPADIAPYIDPAFQNISAIFGLSVLLHQEGVLSIAYLLGVLLFVFDLFGPLKALYGEATRLTVMNAALDRIEAVLEEPELPDTGKQHIPVQTQPGQPEVQFGDVAFAYQDKEVLHHINFAMKKNSMTALVGPSGGGKSTIANLLARLWDVKSGSVTIRGVDIRNVPLSELMDQISMVFQRVYLFQDTIYNNISMGKPDATKEEVYEAAKKARCYDFIMALPDGFQTVVGEGGATLSGGEKQRISIARCILKDAPIVILDEATASVDTDNESYIQEAISELVKGKTLLVIAHRLNTIQNADQILVIDNGQIAQHGTHEELLEQPGIYQDFVNIRKSAVGWSLT